MAARVQLNVVFGVALVGIKLKKAPLQIAGGGKVLLNAGSGFTVIVNDCGVPVQPLLTGVTVIVAVTGEVPLLVALNDAMLPLPLAARPIDVLLFVQLNVVPL